MCAAGLAQPLADTAASKAAGIHQSVALRFFCSISFAACALTCEGRSVRCWLTQRQSKAFNCRLHSASSAASLQHVHSLVQALGPVLADTAPSKAPGIHRSVAVRLLQHVHSRVKAGSSAG